MNIAPARKANLALTTFIACLSLAATATAADLLLEFKGGNGSSEADQYEGAAGDGWETPWKTAQYSGEINASVEKDNPLNRRGEYLAITFKAGDGETTQGTVFRQYAGVQADAPHSFSFLIRGDSPHAGQDQAFSIFANTGSGKTGTDPDLTWGVRVSERGWHVCKGNGDGTGAWERTNMAYVEGQVYEVTVKVHPAQKIYEVTISDGAGSYESETLGFRADSSVDGTFLYFGAVGTELDQAMTFSLDSLRIRQDTGASARR